VNTKKFGKKKMSETKKLTCKELSLLFHDFPTFKRRCWQCGGSCIEPGYEDLKGEEPYWCGECNGCGCMPDIAELVRELLRIKYPKNSTHWAILQDTFLYQEEGKDEI
jgi:hypothetical protein